jgi:hypothetical protein
MKRTAILCLILYLTIYLVACLKDVDFESS